ncbi:MAG: transglutaminase domain-containing protein [Planctomycetes bacterium]|nr:transglutaminase domain-containing protein [Planctomycetota bacterium]
MIEPLHLMLLALTLLDLGFVHATHAVPGLALAPLWLLALASPWMRRLQRFTLYRAAWNVGVLIVFAMLVQNATSTGLLHMLEDGLVLAVLCQVHLLNNVGERQRPDLTFFNSFLIAFVTSFFAPDISWSLLFAAHGALLVPALTVHALRAGGRVATALPPGVLAYCLRRAAVVGVATAAVFVLWPRDFERRGWLDERLSFGEQLQAGLTERIELDRGGRSPPGDQVVARFTPLSGSLDEVPTHWRAIAFTDFDGRTWSPQDAGRLGSRFATDTVWQSRSDGSWRRDERGPPRTQVRVQLFSAGIEEHPPVPMNATRLTPERAAGRLLDSRSDAAFSVVRVGDVPAGPMIYTVGIAQPAPSTAPSAATRALLSALPRERLPDLLHDLSTQLRASLPADADDLAIAAAASDWLERNRRYQLPGGQGFAANFGEFLLGTAAGHCEYFATALALLLRDQGVPCRLVGGFLVHEPSADGTALVTRARDAHAWVEVLAADGSWHTFDATPAADVLREQTQAQGWWDALTGGLEDLWAQVTGFDAEAQRSWLAALATLPLRHPAPTILLVALAALLMLRRRRRRAPAIADLERALRRCGLRLARGETPRELLARAPVAALPPTARAELERAVRRHEQRRYAAPGGRS